MPSLSNTSAALRKSAGCIDTDDNSADFSTGPPNPRNSSAPVNSCISIVNALPISQIQGSGDSSPVKGLTVSTTGIVTALKSNGFFLQSADADSDGDPATSEGLFVFTSSAPPASAVPGAMLRVSGTVSEFAPASDLTSPTLTELVDPVVTEVLSTNNPLPAPAAIVSTLNLERYEGMRVMVPALTVTGPTGGNINETSGTATTNGTFYAVLAGTARPYREPGYPHSGGASRGHAGHRGALRFKS
jgi:Predicted extracellular nuclease